MVMTNTASILCLWARFCRYNKSTSTSRFQTASCILFLDRLVSGVGIGLIKFQYFTGRFCEHLFIGCGPMYLQSIQEWHHFFYPHWKISHIFPLFFVLLLRERIIHLRDMLELLEFFDDNKKKIHVIYFHYLWHIIIQTVKFYFLNSWRGNCVWDLR